jgi:hypothetical protein
LTPAIEEDGFSAGLGDAGFGAGFEVGFMEELLIRTE